MATTLQSDSGAITRILLVEDNDVNRQLMTDYLRYCGYEVFSISRGESFAAAMSQFYPHLILLDLKLPDIDGYTLLQQIQQIPDWSEIPVIVVSAFAFQADQQRALNLGARRYLVKPVKLPELINTISEELSSLAV
jgi:two-component system cell cycle response regulator DivK